MNHFFDTIREFLIPYIIFSGVVGVILLWKNPPGYWKTFPFFLILLGVLDSLSSHIYKEGWGTYYYSGFILPAQITYYLWLLGKENPDTKPTFPFSILLMAVVLVAEITLNLNNPNFYFASISFSLGAILLLFKTLWYFYHLSESEKILTFYKEPMFWVALGLLVYWLLSLPYYGIFNFLYVHYGFSFPAKNLYSFVLIFNYFMYTCFIVSFICGLKKK